MHFHRCYCAFALFFNPLNDQSHPAYFSLSGNQFHLRCFTKHDFNCLYSCPHIDMFNSWIGLTINSNYFYLFFRHSIYIHKFHISPSQPQHIAIYIDECSPAVIKSKLLIQLNQLTEQMKTKSHFQEQFSAAYSYQPLHSPSPDNKITNSIIPTVSPNIAEVALSPTPKNSGKKCLMDAFSKPLVIMVPPSNEDLNTEVKRGHVRTPRSETQKVSLLIREKDNMIVELKNIISMMSDGNSSVTKPDSQQQQYDQIRILTIQNQKLVQIIQRKDTSKGSAKLERQIGILKEIIQSNDSLNSRYFQQIQQMRECQESLSYKCKQLSLKNTKITEQNQKLLKILKQNSMQTKKLQEFQRQLQRGEKPHTASSSKLTIIKIKEQYQQDLKQYKQNVYFEVENMFETISSTLQQINLKMDVSENKIIELQNALRRQKKNSIRKSDIYIQQCPSSQSQIDRISKVCLSRTLQESKKDNDKLQAYIAQLKGQLQELRFKYDKICLDTLSIQYSKRSLKACSGKQLIIRLQKAIDSNMEQIEIKNNEVVNLQGRIVQIEEQTHSCSQQKDKEIEVYRNRMLETMKKNEAKYQKEIESLKNLQRTTKMSLLNQIQILRNKLTINKNSPKEQQRILVKFPEADEQHLAISEELLIMKEKYEKKQIQLSKVIQIMGKPDIIQQLSAIQDIIKNDQTWKLQHQYKQLQHQYKQLQHQYMQLQHLYQKSIAALASKVVQNDTITKQLWDCQQKLQQSEEQVNAIQQKIKYVQKCNQLYIRQLQQKTNLYKQQLEKRQILQNEFPLMQQYEQHDQILLQYQRSRKQIEDKVQVLLASQRDRKEQLVRAIGD